MYQSLNYQKQGPVSVIQINRPQKKNSLNTELRHEMEEVMREIAADAKQRAVILTGGEEIFCAGADISEIEGAASAEAAYQHAREFQILFEQLEALPQPVIAAVSGYALGGGCELALACDFRIASDTARFGLPEIKIGAFPGGGGTQRLPRLIGTAKAKEMILIGDPITAEQALAVGLVMKVTPKARLMEEANAFAVKLASLPRLALQASKMLINRSQEMDLASGLELEARSFGAIAHTHDLAEGTKAFMEKRKPNFTGD
ncbi:MAG: enoyl-CoA hydratase [Deltaproteobacteria bacterium]|nr:enoyl-CoA hydratase [Deltaproteobacteria bacterium]MBI2182241.1 enoyl-CoA hydratase [Deltaproteobacteria bacterium]MBI2531346.1 enoyl-CoA hydratase [Deltaproteobacteria bacterium]